MTADLSIIHPDLRQLYKRFPRFTINRWNLRLIRWLIRLVLKQKIPAGIEIEHKSVPNPDSAHPIRLRVYRPKSVLSPAPVLIWFHGGGYVMGAVEMEDAMLSQFAQELGILAVSVDYRLAPDHPFPAPLDDCYAALKWVREHAVELSVDPARIAVGGESAGGGLAAALVQLALDRGEVKPVFQLLVYPMLDDRTVLRPDPPHKDFLTWSLGSNCFGWESYLGQPCGLDRAPAYSAAARREDITGLPPAWIGVGTLDLFYEEDAAYARKLKDCGVGCEVEVIQGAFHGFDVLDPDLQVVKDFRSAEIAALRKALRL